MPPHANDRSREVRLELKHGSERCDAECARILREDGNMMTPGSRSTIITKLPLHRSLEREPTILFIPGPTLPLVVPRCQGDNTPYSRGFHLCDRLHSAGRRCNFTVYGMTAPQHREDCSFFEPVALPPFHPASCAPCPAPRALCPMPCAPCSTPLPASPTTAPPPAGRR